MSTETQSAADATLAPARLLHTMLRVRDLDKSLDFYVRILGMQMLRKMDFPGGRFTLAFVGYGPEETHAVIELTHNWDQAENYTIGSGYGHLALATPQIYETCDMLEKQGVTISRPPGPLKGGTRVIAFIDDPDGYKIELVQRD